MARIYVSSTYGDLEEHREHVYQTLRQLGHDVIAMEDYVAADQRPLERCLADVAASDFYVGVFAHRYGYIPQEENNPEGRSITELEYRHARAEGKPCLVFLLDEAAPWPPIWIDAFTGDGEGGRGIRALREELRRDRLVSFFATAEELAQKVGVAVTNQLRDRQVTGQPAVASGRGWTIPPPVRSFTGRDDQLVALRALLTDQGAATLVPTAALTGMGGVGKTQLALAYAQRHRGDYNLGWWVPAETELGMLTALAELGSVLGLPEQLPPAELAARTRTALGERSGWLLVFDNAPDSAAVADYLPGTGGGHVLVTSRDSAWQGIADPLPVDLLSAEDAVELLVRRTGDPDQRSAARLAEALGRLPLALEQAAAYAASQRLSLARYLELFTERRKELLALGRPLAYQGTVDATFTLAREQLQAANPAAVQLLELCALLAPDELPLPSLLSNPARLPEPLAAAVADPLRRGEVTGLLYQTGLLTRDLGGTARMHRLVQAVLLAHLPDPERTTLLTPTIDLLGGLWPANPKQPAAWPACARLLPHLNTIRGHARQQQLATPVLAVLADLLTRAGHYIWARGLGASVAHDLDEQALTTYQQLHGEHADHPDIATSLLSLASDLRGLGEYQHARDRDEQAVAMYRGVYGQDADHPDIAQGLNNLGTDLRALGEHARAFDLHEQAFAMRQRLHGEQTAHPDIAQSLNNLGIDLYKAGDHQRAREFHEQALAMRQRLYDDDHPDVAQSLNNLALDLSALGEPGRARELNEQALAMHQRLYEGDHPKVATSLHNLAGSLRELGERGRARELDEQALAMRQRLHEGDHPDVADSLSSLADDLRGFGEHERAWELDEQAVAMRQRLSEQQAMPES